MVGFFSKLFNIRPNEWPRFLLLYLITIVYATGLIWAMIILNAAFLEHVGASALPWFFFTKAILTIPTIAIYAAFADRLSNDKLFVAIFTIACIAYLLGIFMRDGLQMTKFAYSFLYMVTFVPLASLQGVHWYTYVNGFYDTRSAKRILPLLITAISIASIIAGLTVGFISSSLPFTQVVLLIIGVLFLASAMIWIEPRLFGKQESSDKTIAQKASYLENMREGYQFVRQSSFLMWMSIGTFTLLFLFTFVTYLINMTLQENLQTTSEISSYLGRISTIANIIILPTQLFLLNRIVARIGLGNANFIFPTTNLLATIGLLFAPQALWPVAVAQTNQLYIYSSIGNPISNLLYNAVPLRVKGRARAFIGGGIVTLGSLLGSIVLIGIQQLPEESLIQFLHVIIAGLGLMFLVFTPIIRRQYTKALIAMLEQEDYSFLLAESASDLSVSDPAALQTLAQQLENSQSPEFTLFMAKLISDLGGEAAIPILSKAAHQHEAGVRARIIDIVVSSDVRGSEVEMLYATFLKDPDANVRISALSGLEEIYGINSRNYQELAIKILEDRDVEVRLRVLPALLHSNNKMYLDRANAVLEDTFKNESSVVRSRGIQILGQVGSEEAIRQLINHLDDVDDPVRLEAALAIDRKAQGRLSPNIVSVLQEHLETLSEDSIERVRQLGFTLLAKIGKKEQRPLLVNGLLDSSPIVRETAVNAMIDIGKPIIQTLHPLLDSSDAQQRKMAAVVLSNIDQHDFGPLVTSHITSNLLTIYKDINYVSSLQTYKEQAGVSLLQSSLREERQTLTDEIFYLLSAIHNKNSVKIIRQSLQSEDPLVRANAAEALESLTTPQTAMLIGPLFEPETDIGKKLLYLSQETWDMEQMPASTLLRQLANQPHNTWTQALALYSIGEIGSKTSKSGKKLDKSKRQRRQPRRPNPLDALSGLGQDEGKSEPAPRRSRPDFLSKLNDDDESTTDPSPSENPFTREEIDKLINLAQQTNIDDVKSAALVVQRMLSGQALIDLANEEDIMLSAIEKIIFLKEVPFFQGMTVEQLKILATVCEEAFFSEDTRIYQEGDPGGELFVVVTGRVAIEREGRRKGSFARLETIEAHSYFGEMNLFDNSPRDASAITIKDTLTLRLRREPLIALARQNPALSLKLIDVLSQRLREVNDMLAGRTRTKPSELHKLFDQFE